jgi:hypothetical protein
MWKKLGLAAVILLILIAGAGYYLFSNLDSLIKAALEKYGSQATQTAVSAGSVSLSVTTGAGAITGLSVANPPGYSSASAISLGGITFQLDTASLPGSGPIIVDNITITAPVFTYEVRGLGPGSNLQTIQDNIQSYLNGGGANRETGLSGAATRKEIIRDLTITGGQVIVIAPALSGKPLAEPLPATHFAGLGGSTGATPAQIGAQIMNTVAREAAGAGAAALINHQLGAKIVPPAAGSLLKSLIP